MTEPLSSEQRAKKRMNQVFKLFTELSGDHSFHFEKVLKLALKLVDMEIGIISQIEGDAYEIKDIYTEANTSLVKGQEFALQETYCSLTYASNNIVDLDHIGTSEFVGHPCYTATQLEAYIGVPILVSGKRYGTLNFSSSIPRKVPFNQFDRDFVLYLGQWVGQHISRLEYEEQLDEKNKQLQELLDEREKLSSILIHDLKSPLNNLSGLLDLSESMTDDHVISDMMKNSLNVAFNLVTDLQEINQLEQGLTKFKPIQLNGVEIAEIIISQFINQAQAKEINLVLLAAKELITIESDMKLLCRALNNLVSNAIKFSPLKSTVEISVFQENEQLHYRVRDQGPGINAEDQKKLFRRFQKLSAKPTASEHSSGLGLFIVKENCKLLGADIHMESSQRKGTTFTLSVPIKNKEKQKIKG
ncbi:MAG: GAF domain-containing sensor histidine kinase [Reichenbachiella sp.]|uniref:GAF domain-containing sensor histidine kinase n=1 Tax=Reichenbachiella sp. TaxID=2184521 RepID=UPI003265F71C